MCPQIKKGRRKMKLLNGNILFAILVAGFVLGISENSGSQGAKKQFLSDKIYSDPKGFFRIRPPEGWQIQEFRDDPRGKIKIICTEAYNTVIQVIAMASPFSNFEELVRDSEGAAERLRYKFNADVTTEKTTFANAKAVKVYFTMPGKLKQMQIQFLLGKNHYTLVYGAPPDIYEEFLPIAMISIGSFEPILKDVTEEEAIQHTVASRLRTAKLIIQAGQKEYALAVINEGLQLNPDNKELMELKKQLEEK
ncbi:MAG: hypothetical protein A2Z72_06200 [Omnitrophica bacterium RBG_13_46_9]|nr:MAG: hypothetical protein A2Z72_06200 [Omnitrophica bacterium RBG_13_46_9]